MAIAGFVLGIPLIIERNVNSHIVGLVCLIQRKIMHGTQCHEVQRSNKTKIMRNAFWKTHETYNLCFFKPLQQHVFCHSPMTGPERAAALAGMWKGPRHCWITKLQLLRAILPGSPMQTLKVRLNMLQNQWNSDTSGLAIAGPELKVRLNMLQNQWNIIRDFRVFLKLGENGSPRLLGRFRWSYMLWIAPWPIFCEKNAFYKKVFFFIDNFLNENPTFWTLVFEKNTFSENQHFRIKKSRWRKIYVKELIIACTNIRIAQ